MLLTNTNTPRSLALSLSVVVAVLTAGSLLWAAARLRERPEYQGRGGKGPFGAFRDVARSTSMIWKRRPVSAFVSTFLTMSSCAWTLVLAMRDFRSGLSLGTHSDI